MRREAKRMKERESGIRSQKEVESFGGGIGNTSITKIPNTRYQIPDTKYQITKIPNTISDIKEGSNGQIEPKREPKNQNKTKRPQKPEIRKKAQKLKPQR